MAVGTQDLQFNILARVVGGQALDGLKNQLDSIQKSSKFLETGLKVLGAAFGVEKSVEFGKSLLESADQLGKMSQKTGIAVETLAKFQGAAELADVPLESLGKGLNKLALNAVEAANGNQDLAGIFKSLGIQIRDSNGTVKDAGTLVKEIGDKFQGFQDGPNKAAIAIKLFGKAGADLIPFLNEGSAEMEKFGLAIDQDFAARSTQFLDSMKVIGIRLKNGAIDNMKVLLPTLQDLASAFSELVKSKNDFGGFFEFLGESARVVAQVVVVSFYALVEVFDRTVTSIKEMKLELKAMVGLDSVADQEKYQQLKKSFADRQAARDLAEKNFLHNSNKGSTAFGDGTASDFAGKQGESAGNKPAAPDLGGENAKILRQFDEKIAKLNAEAAAVGQSNVEKQAGVLIAELEAKGIAKSSKAYEVYSEKIRGAVENLEKAKEYQAATDYSRKEKEQIDLQRLQLENYDLSTAELQKLTEAKQLDNAATEATIHFTDEGRQKYMEATEEIKKQKAALIDLQEQQKQSYGYGATQAMKTYVENAKNVAKQTEAAFTHAFSNMEDALVEFVKTGKLNFDKLAQGIIDDIIRIEVRAAMAKAITGIADFGAGLFGSGSGATTTTAGGAADSVSEGASDVAYAANGGIMSSRGMLPLNKYARGGIATSPQVAVFGEGAMNEAYVPLPDGRAIPVNMKGSNGGTNVSVVVNMADGSTSIQGDQAKGQTLGKLIAAAVKNELIQQKRPGGILA